MRSLIYDTFCQLVDKHAIVVKKKWHLWALVLLAYTTVAFSLALSLSLLFREKAWNKANTPRILVR